MVERYRLTGYDFGTEPHSDGAWVAYHAYATLERQIAELRAERDTLAMHLEAKTILADRDKADKARLSEALTEVRSLMIVERTDDGRIAGIGHASDALPKIVAILDAALSGSGAGGWRMTPRMAEAGKAKLLDLGYTDVEFTDAQKVFEAMMAAAPTATGGQ